MLIDRTIQNGSLLLAEPFMFDSHFKRSVVLICEDSKEGTVGFIINKPMNMLVNDLLPDFPEKIEAEVFYGGPVKTDTLHYLHCRPELLPDSQMIMEGVYWGGEFETLKTLMRHELITPNDIRFYVGYSGWSSGQLRDELITGSWIQDEGMVNHVFGSQSGREELWHEVLKARGGSFHAISNMSDMFYN